MNASLLTETDPTAEIEIPPQARQCLYRFAALTLLDPRHGAWEQLNSLRASQLLFDAAAVFREARASPPGGLARGERGLEHLDPENVLATLPATAAELNEEYERVFGLLVSSDCPPYETEYINSKFTFQRSNGLADIAGFYRAFGLDRSQAERHDHIVLQLEFMAHLSGLLHHAESGGGASREERTALVLKAQKRFLAEHLGWWAPVFATLLTHRAQTGFYEAAARFLGALIPAERAVLSVERAAIAGSPSRIERPEECEGCMISL